jgi:hypothetical protein
MLIDTTSVQASIARAVDDAKNGHWDYLRSAIEELKDVESWAQAWIEVLEEEADAEEARLFREPPGALPQEYYR